MVVAGGRMTGLPLILGMLAGCGSDAETADLYGIWGNLDPDDAVTWRVWEFESTGTGDNAGIPDAFTLYLYSDGAAPVPVQRGTFVVSDDTLVNVDGEERTEDDVLVQTITWTADGSNVGSVFGDPLLDFSAGGFTLASDTASAGERDFDKLEALP
jgi:hypothetical protein